MGHVFLRGRGQEQGFGLIMGGGAAGDVPYVKW